MKTYLFIYLGSALLALVITPVVNLIARRLGIVDIPGPRHMHTKPTSHIGGVAIFVSAMSPAIVVLFGSNIVGDALPDVLPEFIVLLCAAGFVFFVGLIDDIRAKGLQARVKFFAQLVAAVAVCAVGIRIESVVVADWFTLDFGWFSWPLTLLWIVGVTNAVNLSDGLDGLAAGISAVACGVIAVLGFYSGNLVIAILMLALLGSLTGFLFFNRNPAKIFMGDCGSMFLGFTIASSSVLCSMKSRTFVDLALPALALGIPVLDTLFCILRRLLEGRSPFAPDRRHFHHKMLESGLTQRQVVMVICGLTVFTTGLGMPMMVTANGNSVIIFFVLLLFLLLVFYVVGCIRPSEIVASLRRIRTARYQRWRETKSFEDAQLHFRRATTFDQWWRAVSTAADKMDFSSLYLPLTNRGGISCILTWRQNGQEREPRHNGLLKLHLPIPDHRSGLSLDLEIKVHRNGSLESATRRIALFARLIDQHNMVNFPRDTKASQLAQENVYSVTLSDIVEPETTKTSLRNDRVPPSSNVPGSPGGSSYSHGRMGEESTESKSI
ncbi:MAG: MraY family glycosyltransferase [Planctomycetota bacterium]|nr:MraY family glycosyltransferase [Planctomycetota bacterium]